MELLFHRNPLVVISHSETKCQGYDNCLHPESVRITKILTSFKDEPKTYNTLQSCPHKDYYGPCCVVMTDFTREEYENMIAKNTICGHPDEKTTTQDYMCYKCNAVVSSEKERHKCGC